MDGIAGARVLVTGGAAGIGRVMAERFHEAGAVVAICDADADAVARMREDNPEIRGEVADIRDEAQVDLMFDEVLTRMKGLDVVLANAGTGGPAGRIEDIGFADWKDCLAVNLDGAFLTCRRAAPVLKAQGAGSLILTSSTAGLFGYPFRSPYAAAKWGIIGLMKTLAMELGPSGVRVNALCPGAVSGPRMDRVVANEAAARGVSEDEIRQLYVKGVSMKTWVEADDVADMALFLASDSGRKISGQAMAVDGHTETIGD